MSEINLGRVVGKSAYEIACDYGFVGTEEQWIESLKGEQGEQGIQGEKGDTGTTGPQGPQGEKGEKGDTFTFADLTDEEKEELKQNITTINAQFKSTYNVTSETSTVPINISQYAYGVDLLDVFVNGLRLVEGVDYTNDGTNITLTNALTTIGQVHFVCTKSIGATTEDLESFLTRADVDSALSSSSTNPVQNKVVTTELNGLRTKRIGEIYNSSSYYKIDVIGYYARPIEFVVKTSKGAYERFMFGQSVTAKQISEGSAIYSSFKYIAPTSNATTGTLLIKSSSYDIAVSVFYTANYNKNDCTIVSSTEEEWNTGTDFTDKTVLRDFTTKTEVANTYASKTDVNKRKPYQSLSTGNDSYKFLRFVMNGNANNQVISITDQYGGCIEIYGSLYGTNDGSYKKIKAIRKSYGYHADSSIACKIDYKIRTVKFDKSTNTIYIELKSWATIGVDGAINPISLTNSIPETAISVPLEFGIAQFDSAGNDIVDTYATKTTTDNLQTQITSNDTDITDLQTEIKNLKTLIGSYSTGVMPIGATYMQYTDESEPADIFGGTWTCFSGGSEPIKIWKRTS